MQNTTMGEAVFAMSVGEAILENLVSELWNCSWLLRMSHKTSPHST